MRKKMLISSISFFFIFCSVGFAQNRNISVIESEKPITIEEKYKLMKFTSAENAINKFEKKYKTKVLLPKKTPFKIVYKYGKIHSDKRLELNFLSKDHDILQIYIDPNKTIREKTNWTLKNGNEVILHADPPKMMWLILEKNDFQYVLALNGNRYGRETLINIAESID